MPAACEEEHTWNSAPPSSHSASTESGYLSAQNPPPGRVVFQSEDQSWRWQPPVTEVQHIHPTGYTNAGHSPSRRPVEPVVHVKPEPSSPVRPGLQGNYDNQHYNSDPGPCPSSLRTSRQQGHPDSTSLLPIFNDTVGQSAQSSYNDGPTRHMSYPSYVGGNVDAHNSLSRAKACEVGAEPEDAGVAKCNDTCRNMPQDRDMPHHYSNANHQPVYSYPRPAETAFVPTHIQTSFESRSYRLGPLTQSE